MEFTAWTALDLDALQLLPGAEAQLNPVGGTGACTITCAATCTLTNLDGESS